MLSQTTNQTRVERPSQEAPHLRRARAGHLEVRPRPNRGTVDRFYESDYHETARPDRLDRIDHDLDYWRGIWKARLDLVSRALGESPGLLLDVGSGGGHFLSIAREQGFEVQGVEPSIAAADYAQEKFQLPILRETLERAVFEVQFDIVHCAMVLEHVIDPEAFTRRMISCVRPGGLLFVEVPNDFSVLQRTAATRLGVAQWWIVPDHHLNYFDFDSLSRLCSMHGASEIDRLGSFPMEMFLLMGVDYVRNRAEGRDCHRMRTLFERALIEEGQADALLQIQRGFAQAGIGRTCQLLCRVEG